MCYNNHMKFEIPQLHLIPAVRMTRAGKWIVPKAQHYLANQEALGYEYKRIMGENDWQMLPEKEPLYISWVVVRTGPLFKCDFDNLIKSLCDAAKGIIFPDDRCITLDLGGEKRQGEDLVVVEFGLVADLRVQEK